MHYFKLVLVTVLFLSFTLIELANAQVRRGPQHPVPPHRIPDYRPVPHPGPAPRPVPRDDYYSRGRVTCTATDKGWEEHFGGHSSCGACLQKHGSCIEKCHEVRELCEVEGVDYRGRKAIFRGYGIDRRSAEYEARRACEWNRVMRSCYVKSCRQESKLISSRSCR